MIDGAACQAKLLGDEHETPLCWYKDINQMPQLIQHTFRNRNDCLTLEDVTSLAFTS